MEWVTWTFVLKRPFSFNSYPCFLSIKYLCIKLRTVLHFYLMTPVNTAETIKFCVLFRTKYKAPEQNAADKVENTRKNFLPSRSIPKIAIKFAGNAAVNVIRLSKNTLLGICEVHCSIEEWDPRLTTKSVTVQTDASWLPK